MATANGRRDEARVTQLFCASYRAYRPDWGQAVVTSLGLPRWRLAEAEQWPRAWVITPTAELLGEPDPAKYAAGYRARLERFGVPKIARTLERIATDFEADRLVLLCHESDWSRCHRKLIAEFWLSVTGEMITELAEAAPDDVQPPLFPQ